MNYKEKADEVMITMSDETREALRSGMNIVDLAHQHADGHENVIYYYKAHENWRDASTEERDRAEESFEESGGLGDDTTNVYDKPGALLSYWLEYHRFVDLVSDELTTLKCELEDLLDEIDSDINDLDTSEDLIPSHDYVKEIISKVETIIG